MVEKVTAYEKIGGEPGVRELVDRFYDIMDSDGALIGLRQMHAKSLKGSREKLFLFLSGWLGGPDLYVQKYGHPRLRARHMPFSIGVAERDQWMACMNRALDEMDIEPALRKALSDAFWKTADFMRNRSESEAMQGIPVRAEILNQHPE
jgi:hemoglobin